MMPISYDDAQRRHPELVAQVLDKLGRTQRDVKGGQVSWYLHQCHDDADEPLDEGAAADLLLTGSLPCRYGLCGKIGGHFGCACIVGSMPVSPPASRRH